jgi:very-short-patch-repair endonuclease
MFINYKNLPFNPALRQRARDLRNNMTFSEVLLWKELYRKKFMGLNFDRQKIIGNYIVDFYCPDIGMVIEIDGSSHDHKEKYDLKRHKYIESLGLLVIHIDDRYVKKNIQWPLSLLYEKALERIEFVKTLTFPPAMTTPES